MASELVSKVVLISFMSFSREVIMVDSKTEYSLNSPPEDGITAVKFAPNSNQFLLASSWDCNVSLYDITNNNLRLKYAHSDPVLDCCFQVIPEVFFSWYKSNNLIHHKVIFKKTGRFSTSTIKEKEVGNTWLIFAKEVIFAFNLLKNANAFIIQLLQLGITFFPRQI
jgi:WD domain, G-beta repeat.